MTTEDKLKDEIKKRERENMNKELKKEIERLSDKYEIYDFIPNNNIKNWFDEFEKDMNNLIQQGRKDILEKLKECFIDYSDGTKWTNKEILLIIEKLKEKKHD